MNKAKKLTDKSEIILIFVTMIIMIVGNSRLLVDYGVEAYVEYFAYGVLMVGILYAFFTSKPLKERKNTLIMIVIVGALFSIGILVQGLAIGTKIRLIATMGVIAIVALASEDYMCSFKKIRLASYGILIGTVITTIMALIGGSDVLETSYEGILSVGFKGGVEYKNFYGANILASFMGIFFYYRYYNVYSSTKVKKLDLIVMIFEVILIFLSSSRGTYLMLFAFLALIFYEKCEKIDKKKLRIYEVVVCVCGVIAIILAFAFILPKSATYMYRLRGIKNYLNYCEGDIFHLMFGNAEMAFGDGKYEYIVNIRRHVGWDGSYEMGFINTLIKNGLLGLMGFGVVFSNYARNIFKSQNWKLKTACLSVMLVLLLSAFVESYVCNIHAFYGVYSYMLMCGIVGMMKKEEEKYDSKS